MKNEIDICDDVIVHPEVVEDVKKHLPCDDVLYQAAEVFKVFGDKTRIKILYLLHTRELCVCDIAQLMDMNQSAISHQLRVLKNAKLIKSRREGKQVFYSLDDEHVRSILAIVMEHISE